MKKRYNNGDTLPAFVRKTIANIRALFSGKIDNPETPGNVGDILAIGDSGIVWKQISSLYTFLTENDFNTQDKMKSIVNRSRDGERFAMYGYIKTTGTGGGRAAVILILAAPYSAPSALAPHLKFYAIACKTVGIPATGKESPYFGYLHYTFSGNDLISDSATCTINPNLFAESTVTVYNPISFICCFHDIHATSLTNTIAKLSETISTYHGGAVNATGYTTENKLIYRVESDGNGGLKLYYVDDAVLSNQFITVLSSDPDTTISIQGADPRPILETSNFEIVTSIT